MEIKNGRKRSSEVRQRNKGSQFESQSRSMGTLSETSAEPGTYSLGTSGEDSNKRDSHTSRSFTNNSIPGKIISQLVDETEKQLAYHEEQAEILRDRLKELKEVTISHTE
ncbi:MAG: hypothetical protein RM049_07510 [Nostoc sp. DedQUE04]|uniref:hypothetical protein n=1 Tax=Nostoc sp. DedQUE04 TaxID=3075390 RepID=UPI002AD55696|nr:hypothetical protein [Nostoc sp. DedQUE04]MDZ8135137.1 hypothetical protein [Nostoc sp. DedQUE04]